MHEILLDYSNIGKHFDQWWDTRHKEPKHQPFSINPEINLKLFYILRKELHKWLKDHKIKYSLRETENLFTCIIFEKESDAILFKLTWC